MHQSMLGSVIGNYRILRCIGEGGMGAVYVAEHTLIGRHAAIKVLLRELSWRQDLVQRFFNEARAATAVKHHGIVEIYDFGYHTDGSAYIVMEYLEGETVALRLRRTGTLPEGRAAALCRQVASALGAAHAKGIVHRDLKPDNIYIVRDPDLDDGERTKILDFGIAKLIGSELPGQSMTRTGAVMGTPPYMSPEQCKGAGTVDHRTDLYALGCILFEMVCGRAPFVAEGSGEIMAQHIFAPPPLPSSLRPVTPQLEQVILHALAKEPSQRFQSADDMLAALRSAVPPGIQNAGASSSAVHAAPAYPALAYPALAHPASAPPPLPRPVTGPATAPQVTTLSHAAGSTAASRAHPRPSWLAPAIAATVVAVGAVGITLAMRGGERSASTAAQHAELPAAPPAAAPQTTPAGAPERPSAPLPSAAPQPVPAGAPEPALAPPPSTAAARQSPPPPAPPEPAPPAAPASAIAKPAASPAPARITLKLTSDPAGADVYRAPKGARIGRTPFDYTIDASDRPVALTFKKAGYSDKQTSVLADRDAEHKVTLARVGVKAAPAPQATAGPGSASANAAAPGSLNPFEKLAPTPKEQ
jgi:serine/threonine protein kinase